jgi:methyl halide transferase
LRNPSAFPSFSTANPFSCWADLPYAKFPDHQNIKNCRTMEKSFSPDDMANQPRSTSNLLPEAWEQRYQAGQDRWDLGCPAPPLINLLNSLQAPKPGRIAVLGCGSGQDAMLFSTKGFDVVAFDFAPTAIQRACATAQNRGLTTQFYQRNIFALEAAFQQNFDYVLEHSCFCAIDPSLRSQYVQVVKDLLKSNGQLIALFYTHHTASGQPFGAKPQEILDCFEPHFDRIMFKPAQDSIDRHRGKEHLAIFQRRSA